MDLHNKAAAAMGFAYRLAEGSTEGVNSCGLRGIHKAGHP